MPNKKAFANKEEEKTYTEGRSGPNAGEPRTATSTCGSDIEEQLDLVGLLDKKPLTPPLTKNVARQLIQKLKVQFRALKEEYRAAKENLRNKGRAAGDGV